jgi:hypothetical protein
MEVYPLREKLAQREELIAELVGALEDSQSHISYLNSHLSTKWAFHTAPSSARTASKTNAALAKAKEYQDAQG